MQAAAIPFRIDHEGTLEVLLITSRTQGRWILPKGNIPLDCAPHEAAAREAFEEAGVAGRVSSEAIGTYRQVKSRLDGPPVLIQVHAYSLEEVRQHATWPEMDQRQRRWWPICDALSLVDEELRQLLTIFQASQMSTRRVKQKSR